MNLDCPFLWTVKAIAREGDTGSGRGFVVCKRCRMKIKKSL